MKLRRTRKPAGIPDQYAKAPVTNAWDFRVLALTAPVRAHWLMGIAAGGVGSALLLVEPLFARVLVEEAFPKHDARLATWTFVIGIAIASLSALLCFSGSLLLHVSRGRIEQQLRESVLNRWLTRELSLPESVAREPLALVTSSVSNTAELLTVTVPAAICAVFEAVAIVCGVLFLKGSAALFLIGGAVIFGSTAWFGAAKLLKRRKQVQRNGEKMTACLKQLLNAARPIRGFERSHEVLEPYRELEGRYMEAGIRWFSADSLYRVRARIGGSFCVMAAALFCLLRWSNATMSAGTGIAIVLYAVLSTRPARVFANLRARVRAGMSEFNRVRIVADSFWGASLNPLWGGVDNESQGYWDDAPVPATVTDTLGTWGGAIEANGVWFEEFKGATFRIERGSRVLFTGRGLDGVRQALFKMLSGAAQPNRGTVAVGAHLIAAMPSYFRRRWISTLWNEPQLLAGTVRDNICLGAPVRASTLTPILEMCGITELNQKIDPRQDYPLEFRHRVQLARLLYFDPEVIFVEGLNRETLKVLSRTEKTIIAVGSYDLMVELVDRVIWVENGVCEAPQTVDAFLFGPRASALVPLGMVQLNLQSRGALLHAQALARRNQVPLVGFTVELFGSRTQAAGELPGVAQAIKRQMGDVELVLFSDRTRLTCYFSGGDADDIESRLNLCVGQWVARRISFRVAA